MLGGLVAGASHYLNSLQQLVRDTAIEAPSDYGLEYTDVSFPTSDGLTIRGWWLEAHPGAPVVIFLHGTAANRATPAGRVFGIARQLIQHGYSLLMFDFRGEGESDGSKISAGLYESNDLLGAIKYLRQHGVKSKIGVLGFSMGAATALLGAAETDQISGVVADSSYSDVESVLKAQLEKRDIPDFVAPLIMLGAKLFYGVDFNLVSPLKALKDIAVPVFIIHGGKDDTVPVDEAFELKSALQNPDSEFWVVPEAEHTDAYFARPQEYVSKLLSFFGVVLRGSPASG